MAWDQQELFAGILEEFAECPCRSALRDSVVEAHRRREGSRRERLRFRYARTGQPRGERHPRHKLTWSIVGRMRARHAAGESANALAVETGVAASLVWRIVNGRAWVGQPQISSNGNTAEGCA